MNWYKLFSVEQRCFIVINHLVYSQRLGFESCLLKTGDWSSESKIMAERSETVGQKSLTTPLCCALNENKLSWLSFLQTATFTEISVQDLCIVRRADEDFQACRTW